MPQASKRIARLAARALLISSQWIPGFRARGHYSTREEDDSPGNAGSSSQAHLEFQDFERLLVNFEGTGFDLREELKGKRVLDHGSGYGGRTAWMAGIAASVDGVEIFPNMVQESRRFAHDRRIDNVRFSLGSEDGLDFADGHFDTVVSFDVLEHVQRPDQMMREFYRVLGPGGTLVVIFTPYFGMFSHHLNYISLFPGLHWFFSAETLVSAVNELLEKSPVFAGLQVQQQPPPRHSYNKKRLCLPTLNGITKSEFLHIVHDSGFETRLMKATPLLERFGVFGEPGRVVNRLLFALPMGDELFALNVVGVLRKSEAAITRTREVHEA